MIFHGICTVSLLSKGSLIHATPTVISEISHILHFKVNITEERKGKIQ